MNHITRELPQFFAGLQYYMKVAQDLRQTYAPLVAPSFSVLAYADMGETLLSKIFCDLLDPKGAHAQGSAFLDAFLQQLNDSHPEVPRAGSMDAVIRTETPTWSLANGLRRIDIRIELPDGFHIGIENKPSARDQMRQMSDYWRDLEKRSRTGFLLLYLTRNGQRPTDSSISASDWDGLVHAKKAANLTFAEDIHSWLLTCQQRCKAEKVRHFLGDLLSYIDTELAPTTEEDKTDE